MSIGFFAASDARRRDRLGKPEKAQPLQLNRAKTAVVGSMHVLCLLAFIPYFFSWSGLALGIAGHFVFGMLGIAIGYHRLLTHRGFKCPKWF